MSQYQFDNIDDMKRNREIEGETGTELGLPGGITLIVLAASDANPRWKEQSDKIFAELNRLKNARAPADKVRAYLSRKYAETLVKDWRGVTSSGVSIPFSVEACAALLVQADDAYASLDQIVYDTKNFRGARIEAIVGEAGNA